MQMLLAEARLLAAPPPHPRPPAAHGAMRFPPPHVGATDPDPDPKSTPPNARSGAAPSGTAESAAAARSGRDSGGVSADTDGAVDDSDALADEVALRRAFAGVLAENGELHLRVNAVLRQQLGLGPKSRVVSAGSGPGPNSSPARGAPPDPSLGNESGARRMGGKTGGAGMPPPQLGGADPNPNPKLEKGADAPSLAGSLFSRFVSFAGTASGGDAAGGQPAAGAAGVPANPKPKPNLPPPARGGAGAALARGTGWAAAVSGGWPGSRGAKAKPESALAGDAAPATPSASPKASLKVSPKAPPATAAPPPPPQLRGRDGAGGHAAAADGATKGVEAPAAGTQNPMVASQPRRTVPASEVSNRQAGGHAPAAPPDAGARSAARVSPGSGLASLVSTGRAGSATAAMSHVSGAETLNLASKPKSPGADLGEPAAGAPSAAGPGSGLDPNPGMNPSFLDTGGSPDLLDFTGLTVYGSGMPAGGSEGQLDALQAPHSATSVGGGGPLGAGQPPLWGKGGGADRPGADAAQGQGQVQGQGQGSPANGRLAGVLQQLDNSQQSLI